MCNTKFKEMTQQDRGRAVRVFTKITAESVGNNKVLLVPYVFFRQVGRVKELKHFRKINQVKPSCTNLSLDFGDPYFTQIE